MISGSEGGGRVPPPPPRAGDAELVRNTLHQTDLLHQRLVIVVAALATPPELTPAAPVPAAALIALAVGVTVALQRGQSGARRTLRGAWGRPRQGTGLRRVSGQTDTVAMDGAPPKHAPTRVSHPSHMRIPLRHRVKPFL